MTSRNGLLLVDKATGMTSHDVVARVRRLFQERSVGHAGTLDPLATGLLVLGIGRSTRLLRFAQAETKRYTGAVRFGVATDSLDADGAVVGEAPVPDLTAEVVAAAAAPLHGDILQIPPMVSAIKQGGRKLYEIAREGGEVERAPRPVTIDSFTLAPTADPTIWTFDVRCSVGTYVRVLAADLATNLGTLGHLVALRREASGDHEVASAHTLDELESLLERGDDPIAPPLDFVSHLERVILDDAGVRAIGQGKRIAYNGASDDAAAVDEAGELVAILRRRGETWQPDVVLRPVS